MDPDPNDPDTEPDRRAMFAMLVSLEDKGEAPKLARLAVADAWGVSVEFVAAVTRQGLDRSWEPLPRPAEPTRAG